MRFEHHSYPEVVTVAKILVSKNDYWWWSKKKGWTPVREMDNKHLDNAKKSLEKHGKSFTTYWYVLDDEIRRRRLQRGANMIPFAMH